MFLFFRSEGLFKTYPTGFCFTPGRLDDLQGEIRSTWPKQSGCCSRMALLATGCHSSWQSLTVLICSMMDLVTSGFQQSKSSSSVVYFMPTLIYWLVLLSFFACSFQSLHGSFCIFHPATTLLFRVRTHKKYQLTTWEGWSSWVLGGWACFK